MRDVWRGGSEHRWLAIAGLVGLVALVYAPALANGFIWDDDGYVTNNQTLRSLAGLRDIWLRLGATPQYYPLVHTTFWIEYQLWGLAPAGYHATNVALHAIAAVLAWRLLARLAVPGAWLAAAVFAVHPVHVESVAWVTERKNVLSMVFALAALLAYLRAAPVWRAPSAPPCPPASLATAEGERRPALAPYALALACYVAALFSKTVTASVPAVLLVIFWWKRGRITVRDVAWLAPFFAIGLALARITVSMETDHVGASGAEWDFSPLERVLIAARALWFYAGKLLWPHPLAFFYPRWNLDATSSVQLAFPIAALAFAAALFLARGRIGRAPLAAVLIFAGVLVPALGFFDVYPFRYSFVADHFQYHASLAWIALVVALAARASPRLPRALAAGLAVAMLVALGATANRVVHHYRDLPTLYASVLRSNPNSWPAHNNLGRYLQNLGQHEAALPHFEAAVRLAPQHGRIRANLGATLMRLGRLDEAEAELRRALAVEGEPTDRADARAFLGVVLMQKGRFGEAVESLHAADGFRPNDPWILYNLGVAIAGAGDLTAGATWMRKAIAADPASPAAHQELGAILQAAGDTSGAASAFAEAKRLEKSPRPLPP